MGLQHCSEGDLKDNMSSNKKKSQEKVLKLKFDVDPYTGIASLISKITPVGYRFRELNRKGTKAVATFVKKEE